MLQHRTTVATAERRPYDRAAREGNEQGSQQRHHVLARAKIHETKPRLRAALPPALPARATPLAAAPALLLHVGKRTRLSIIVLASFSSMPRALKVLPISGRPLPLPPVIIAAAAAPFPPAIALIIALIIVH